MPGDICPFEPCERTHADVVKLRQQKCVNEMAAIDRELWIIDGFLRDLQSRWTRAEKTATASPIEFGLQLLRAGDKVGEMNTEQIVALDHIGIAFFDQCGESPERVSFRFFYVVRIDNDQFIPAGVVRERDAHRVIVVAGVTAGSSEHFELYAFQLLEGEILEQCAAGRSEVMLNRIGKREEIAAGAF